MEQSLKDRMAAESAKGPLGRRVTRVRLLVGESGDTVCLIYHRTAGQASLTSGVYKTPGEALSNVLASAFPAETP